MLQKDLPTVICDAFLTIYTYLYLNEPPEIYSRCMEFILQNPGTSLYENLKADIKVNPPKRLDIKPKYY